ncbi:hypothetical protein ACRAWD_17765 [Caulobacter segnis]
MVKTDLDTARRPVHPDLRAALAEGPGAVVLTYRMRVRWFSLQRRTAVQARRWPRAAGLEALLRHARAFDQARAGLEAGSGGAGGRSLARGSGRVMDERCGLNVSGPQAPRPSCCRFSEDGKAGGRRSAPSGFGPCAQHRAVEMSRDRAGRDRAARRPPHDRPWLRSSARAGARLEAYREVRATLWPRKVDCSATFRRAIDVWGVIARL